MPLSFQPGVANKSPLPWFLNFQYSAGSSDLSMGRPRLLLADSHALMLEGLQTFLEPRFEIVGATDNFESLLKCVSKLAPDVAILDISIPNGQAGALRRLRDLYKHVRIVLLSFYCDVTVVRESLALGVSGYVLKWALTSDLVSAIEEVMVGRIYVSPALRYSG